VLYLGQYVGKFLGVSQLICAPCPKKYWFIRKRRHYNAQARIKLWQQLFMCHCRSNNFCYI